MSTFGNIIWFIFGGFIAFCVYAIAAVLFCITIIGIPFGVASWRQGIAMLAPFGRDTVKKPNGDGVLNILFNVIWIFLFGWELAIMHLVFAAILGITIIGLPFAFQHIKLIPIALWPFGQEFKKVETGSSISSV